MGYHDDTSRRWSREASTLPGISLTVLVLLMLVAGCHERGRSLTPSAAPRPIRQVAAQPTSIPSNDQEVMPAPLMSVPPPMGPPPLAHSSKLVRLPVQGFGDAVVALPLGTTHPRPVVIATHGNYDTPEWQCEVWSSIVAPHAFVLCPRGTARGDSPSRLDVRYHYLSRQKLASEVTAGLEALRQTYAAYVDDSPRVLAGFSQGAIMGAWLVLGSPNDYPYAVFIEGGNTAWTGREAKRFAAGGGRGILFGCGQWDCHTKARAAEKSLSSAGVQVRTVGPKNAGHTYDGEVAKQVRQGFAWLVANEPAWLEFKRSVDSTTEPAAELSP